MLTKYAEASILEVEDAFGVPANVGHKRLARVRRKAHRHHFEYTPRRGYIYVRSRAISSRCNDNYDEFPAEEIKKAYRTFVGKPVFVNHHNSDHRRARGVIIDAALHEDTNPDGTPDTWAEVLMEVDAVRFPVLAREVLKGNIARTSMGTDVEYSVCTACGNKAYSPADYCQHIPKMKGMKHRRFNAATGSTEEVLIAERCYGLGFFENSLLVEDPADPTAFVLGVEDGDEGLSAAAAHAVIHEAEGIVRQASIQQEGYASTRDMEDMLQGRKPRHKQKGKPEPKSTAHPDPKKRDRPYHPPEMSASDWNSRENIDTNNDITPEQRKKWLKDRKRNQRGDATDAFRQKPRPASKVMSLLDADEHRESLGQALATAAAPDLMGFMRDTPAMIKVRYRAAVKEAEEVKALLDGGDISAETIARGERAALALQAAVEEMLSVSAHRSVEALLDQVEAGVADFPVGSRVHYVEPNFGGSTTFEGFEGDGTVVDHTPDRVKIRLDTGEMRFARERDLTLMSTGARRHVHAYGETKAPAKVDTMRAENCPVCGDDEGYNGAKCSVCGYMQPPSQFTDPDLTKAREMDLRQEHADQAAEVGADPFGTKPEDEQSVDTGDDDTLQCTQCGEVFSAEGDAAAEAEPAEDDQDPAATPEHPEDPEAETADEDEPGYEVAKPEVADQPKEKDPLEEAEEIEDEEDDEVEDPADPLYDPAVGEADITAEPEDQPADIGSLKVEPGMTCPVCGEGVLQRKPKDPTGEEPELHEVGKSPIDKAQLTSASRRGVQKEESKDMTNPNPAQRKRSLLVQAVREQQDMIERQAQMIERQDAQIGNLTRGLASLAIAAGVEGHPHFAGLVRQSGLQRRRAADTNNSPEGAPATTTEEAKKPDSTDDVENVGAAPSSANTEVTPDGVTDVNNGDVVANPPVLDNLQDVTKPTPGTDAVVPDAGDAESASRVTVGQPSSESFDKPGDSGWKTSARGDEKERFVASMRLARLQISAGIAEGEDLTVAQDIDKSAKTLAEITAQADALTAVAAKGQGKPAPRNLVPRAAAKQEGIRPSMQAQASTGRDGEDEWAFGSMD